MTAIAEAVIRILADASPVIREAAKAADAMNGLNGMSSRLSRGLANMSNRAAAAGKKLSIITGIAAGATAAIWRMVDGAARAGDAIGDMAQAVGVSGGWLQEIKFALKDVADVSDEELQTSLVKLNQRLGEAAQGSKSAITAFEQVGISAADIAAGTVSTEEAMDSLIATLGETSDPALASAIAVDLLGRSGARMGGAMSGNADKIAAMRDRARELGVVMSDEALDAAGKYDTKMRELSGAFEGLRTKITSEVLPVLVNTLIPAIIDKVIPAISTFVGWIADAVRWFGDLPAPVQEAAGIIASVFAISGPALMAIGIFARTISVLIGASGPIGLFIVAATTLATAWQIWGDDFKAAVGGAIDWVSGKIQAMIDLFWGVVDAAKEIGKAVAEAVGQVEIVSGSSPGVGPRGQTIPQPEAGAGAGASGGKGREIGASLADGVTNGYVERMALNLDAIGVANDGVIQKIRGDYQIQSPSRVMQEIGQFIGQGLAQGITDTAGLVKAAMSTTGAGAVTATEGIGQQIMASLSTLFGKSKAFALAQAAVNVGVGITEALKLPYPQSLAAALKVAAQGASAIKGIRSAKPGSTGGIGSSGGAGGGGASAAPQNNYNLTFALKGESANRGQVGNMFETINRYAESGGKLNIRLV